MIQKLKQYALKFKEKMTSITFLGQLVFAVIVILVSWSGARVIQTNYNLQEQIAVLEQENQAQRIKNENLRLRNQYFETEEYLELAARQFLGKAAEGERVVLIPKDVALSYAKDSPYMDDESVDSTLAEEDERIVFVRNIDQWLDFLFK